MAQGNRYTINFDNFPTGDCYILRNALTEHHSSEDKRIAEANPPWRPSERAMHLGSIRILLEAVEENIEEANR